MSTWNPINRQGNEEEHVEEVIPHDLPSADKDTLRRVAKTILALFVVLLLLGWIPSLIREYRISADAKKLATLEPQVEIVKVRRAPSEGVLTLPADTRAYESTAIYPRSNGYLKSLSVDIGDIVAAGQVLAEIDSPEVDAQLAQAKATLAKAASDAELAKSTLERYESFAKSGGITRQQLDERRSTESQARAFADAARSDVQRLSDLQKFEKVTAPFAGTITSRNYDVGALLSPSTATGTKEFFRIEDTSTIRVFVSVPQAYVTDITVGQPASLLVKNFPGREFKGKIARTANSVDPATRTLYTEIDIPNAEKQLLPGMYGQVKFELLAKQPLLIPTSGIIFDADGTKVATVVDDKVHFKKVVLGRDSGTEIEASEGISENEFVVTNPGQKLVEGSVVKATERPEADKKP